MSYPIDEQTGRATGDHGTAAQAIDYALDEIGEQCEGAIFLIAWRDGSAFEEWPEFYTWLKEEEQ